MKNTAIIAASFVAAAALAFGACGSDAKSDATTTTTTKPATTTTRPATPTTKPATPTTDGGGGAQAGAPQWVSFEITSPVACQGGNATATMKWETRNVVTVAIKVGSGKFESTAGYNPNETAAVVSIPCTGAGTSSVQLRGCTEDNTCADSPVRDVTITA